LAPVLSFSLVVPVILPENATADLQTVGSFSLLSNIQLAEKFNIAAGPSIGFSSEEFVYGFTFGLIF
jgi:hypothetical protein